jgi:uncharacterized protein (TIGR00369 family)
MPVMTVQDIHNLLKETFPQALAFGFRLDEVMDRGARLSLPTEERHLRPGGTVQGPVLMTLADTAAYLALLAHLGPVAMAVTSSLEIHFLRKAEQGVLLAEARLVKVGRRLVVAQVDLSAEGDTELVAVATVTYTLPRSAESSS